MPNPENAKGVIALPAIFGISRSWEDHVGRLSGAGYDVVTVDPYLRQGFKRPFFLPLVIGNRDGKLNALAKKIDDDVVLNQIDDAIATLRRRGKDRICLVGIGLGGSLSLKYAENNSDIAAVATWFPHIIYPQEMSKIGPDLGKISKPVLIQIGEEDDALPQGTIAHINSLALTNPNITLRLHPGTRHAFVDRKIQHFFRNPLYRKEAAEESWNIALTWLNYHSSH